MKKKHRDITVDGVEYAWTVSSGLYGKVVSIWLNKKVIHKFETCRKYSITPKDVQEAITELNKGVKISS